MSAKGPVGAVVITKKKVSLREAKINTFFSRTFYEIYFRWAREMSRNDSRAEVAGDISLIPSSVLRGNVTNLIQYQKNT